MNRISVTITAICLVASAVAYGAKQPAGTTATLPDLIISSKDNYWKTGSLSTVTDGTADVTVDVNNTKQVWEGFGGTYNEMGWDALSVVSSEIPTALKLLFDANEGANLAYGRIPIGASDYAMSWYTLDETAGDYSMSKFSIARDQQKLIPYIKATLEVKPDIHLWASPWVIPSWMASGASVKSDEQTQRAHALYLAKFVEEYAKVGLKIEAVHPQNEPGYARTRWAQQLLIDYFKNYMGPVFAERNLTAEVWCGTMSHPLDSNIALAVARDPESMKYVKGFGLQWNHTGTVPALAPAGRVWQTEHRCGNYNFEAIYWDQSRYSPSKPQNDHLYGEESWQHIRDWIVAGVNSYCAWNMVLDTYGKSLDGWPQNALLVVDRTAKKLIVTPAYYVFRHFSQYVTPGATRIETSGSNDALAFKNPDGKIITHVYNKEDDAKKMTVAIGTALYQFDFPAHSWATMSVDPATPIRNSSPTQSSSGQNELTITGTANGYRIALPSREPGHIDLLTVSGRVLESRTIPRGSREIILGKHARAGLCLVRVVYGSEIRTALLVSAR